MLPSLLSLSLPLLLLGITASASNVTCAKTSPKTEWYYNSKGLNPCQQFEDLYQICEPKFQMFSIQGGVFEYFCQPDSDASDFCCCNSVSFALFSACKSCQWGTPPVAATSQTYGTWLGHCSRKAGITITNGSLPTNLTTEGLVFPPYSFISPTTPVASYKWNYGAAEANATAAKSFTTKSGGLSSGGKAGVAILVIFLIGVGAYSAYRWGWPWYQSKRRGGGLNFDNRRSIMTFGLRAKSDVFSESPNAGGQWREMRDETSHNTGVAPAKSSISTHANSESGSGWDARQSRLPEDDAYGGTAGWGAGGGGGEQQQHDDAYSHQQQQQPSSQHGRDRSFGGGGVNGDGMYHVPV